MQIPNKNGVNGFSIPLFGLGTWQMGGRLERDYHNDDQADITAIKHAVEEGITHIDTAEMYANGYTETLVGEGIKGYNRKSLFLVSKVREAHLGYQDLIDAAHASLERLQTSYLDLYLIHHPNPNIPIEESMRALNTLIKEGVIKNIGVSNFNVDRFKKAQACTEEKLVANQIHYNLVIRESQRSGVLDYSRKNDVIVIAWRPVQKGILTQASNSLLEKLCKKYGKTPAQVAINWLVSQPNVVTLSKMRSKEHLIENLGALGWGMEPGDIEDLDKNFPHQQFVSDAVPLL